MGKGETSRQKILNEAFRLFATLPYERVSFNVLEKETGISRGSMVYYFKNKEGLFNEVLKTFVYGMSSVTAVPDVYKLSLCSFYSYFIETLKRERDKMFSLGIKNVNEALMRIETSALTYAKNFKDFTLNWYENELSIWQSVIEKAISSGEIKANNEANIVKYLFADCYLGSSFHGVFLETGSDIILLEKIFNNIYLFLK